MYIAPYLPSLMPSTCALYLSIYFILYQGYSQEFLSTGQTFHTRVESQKKWETMQRCCNVPWGEIPWTCLRTQQGSRPYSAAMGALAGKLLCLLLYHCLGDRPSPMAKFKRFLTLHFLICLNFATKIKKLLFYYKLMAVFFISSLLVCF